MVLWRGGVSDGDGDASDAEGVSKQLRDGGGRPVMIREMANSQSCSLLSIVIGREDVFDGVAEHFRESECQRQRRVETSFFYGDDGLSGDTEPFGQRLLGELLLGSQLWQIVPHRVAFHLSRKYTAIHARSPRTSFASNPMIAAFGVIGPS